MIFLSILELNPSKQREPSWPDQDGTWKSDSVDAGAASCTPFSTGGGSDQRIQAWVGHGGEHARVQPARRRQRPVQRLPVCDETLEVGGRWVAGDRLMRVV